MSKSPIGSSSSRADEPSFWIFRNEIAWTSHPRPTFTVSVVLEDGLSANSLKTRLIIAYDPRLFGDCHLDLDVEQYNPEYIRKYDKRLLALRPGRARSDKLYRNSFRKKSQQPTTCNSDTDKPPVVVFLSIEPDVLLETYILEPAWPPDNLHRNWKVIFDHINDTSRPSHGFHLSFTFNIRDDHCDNDVFSSWMYFRIVPFPQDRISAAPDLPPRVIRLIMHFSMNIIDWSSKITQADLLAAFLGYGLVRRSWLLPAREVFLQRLGWNDELRIPNTMAFSRYLSAHPPLGKMVTIFNTSQFRIPETNHTLPAVFAYDVFSKELLPSEHKRAIRTILTLCPDVEAVETSPSWLTPFSTILPNLKRLGRMTLDCPAQGHSTMKAKPLLNALNSCRNLTHLALTSLSLDCDGAQSSDIDMQGLSIPLESLAISHSGIDGALFCALLPKLPYGLKTLDLYAMDCRELTNRDFETALRLQSHSLETIKINMVGFLSPLNEVHPIEVVLPEMVALKLLECCDSDDKKITVGILSRKLRTTGTNPERCKLFLHSSRGTVFSSGDISFSDALGVTGWDSIHISCHLWYDIGARRDELFDIVLQAKEVAKRKGIDLVISDISDGL